MEERGEEKEEENVDDKMTKEEERRKDLPAAEKEGNHPLQQPQTWHRTGPPWR